MERFWKKVRVSDDVLACWYWTGAKTSRGYGSIWVGGKTHLAHRVSFELYHGTAPNGLNILHSCDTPLCVNPRHLSVGTQEQNMMQCSERGRIGRTTGEANGQSKLSAANVAEILAVPHSRGVAAALARRFGVSATAIWLIRNGKKWRHVRPPPAAA